MPNAAESPEQADQPQRHGPSWRWVYWIIAIGLLVAIAVQIVPLLSRLAGPR